MLLALTALVVFQLIGEAIVSFLGLPIPGPVLGMALLFLTLLARRGIPASLERTANTLLANFALFFVPAGVGVMTLLGLLEGAWLAIGLALLISTLLSIAVTALVFKWLAKPRSEGGEA